MDNRLQSGELTRNEWRKKQGVVKFGYPCQHWRLGPNAEEPSVKHHVLPVELPLL